MVMGKLTNTSIKKDKKALKDEVVLDKKGRPMTAEQIQERLEWLVGNFRLDFRVHDENRELEPDEEDAYDDVDNYSSVDDELLESYRKDFFALGRQGEIQFHKEYYYYLTELLPVAKRRLNNYAKQNIPTEEDKKKNKKKFIKNREKETLDHIQSNAAYHHEIEVKIDALKSTLLSFGIAMPEPDMIAGEPKKKDSIDKILYGYEPDTAINK